MKKNMADGAGTQKRRGRYKEYMRHSNPYKFPAARRRKSGRINVRKTSLCPTFSHCISNKHNRQYENSEVVNCDTANCETTNTLPSDLVESCSAEQT